MAYLWKYMYVDVKNEKYLPILTDKNIDMKLNF